MNDEERLNLIGMYDESVNRDNNNTLDGLEWTNNTSSKITLEAIYNIIGKTEDNNDDYDDLRWEARAYICMGDTADTCSVAENDVLEGQGWIGYGGANNRQYDVTSHSSASAKFIVVVEPGSKVVFNMEVKQLHEEDPVFGGYERVTIKEKRVLAKIIAVD